MAYLGVTPTTSSQSLVKQDFSVSATQNYTLSQSVTNANDIASVSYTHLTLPTSR